MKKVVPESMTESELISLRKLLQTCPDDCRAEIIERLINTALTLQLRRLNQMFTDLDIPDLGSIETQVVSVSFSKVERCFTAIMCHEDGVPELDVAMLHYANLLSGVLSTAASSEHMPFIHATPEGLITATELMDDVWEGIEWLYEAIEKQMPPESGVTH